jgi:aminopeptidase N
VHKKEYIGLSNMKLESTEPYGMDGMVIDRFAESVRMSTYLVAFVVCDFDRVHNFTKHNNIEVRMHCSGISCNNVFEGLHLRSTFNDQTNRTGS